MKSKTWIEEVRVGVSEDVIYVPLTESEMNKLEKDICEKEFQIYLNNEDKKTYSASINDKNKSIETELRNDQFSRKIGKKKLTGEFSLVPNFGTNKMAYYDNDGEMVFSRELTQIEQQQTMKFKFDEINSLVDNHNVNKAIDTLQDLSNENNMTIEVNDKIVMEPEK